MEDIDIYINSEINKLYNNYWKYLLNKNYIKNCKTKYYRTKIQTIPNIDKIKINVYNKLGYIAPYIFLTSFCSHIKIPGAYNEIEKCILLIEFLLNGFSMNQMSIYIPESNFYKIYQSVFINNRDILNKWLDYMLDNCFSNNILRLLSSKKNNPNNFEHVTLLMDGHHSKIAYQDINLDKKELYSYKLKTNGLNTQFIIDCNNICVYISNSLPCKMNNDDNMFLDIKLNKFLKDTDCICFDGLYENTVNEVIDKYQNIGLPISINNFCFPIKKEKEIDLKLDEKNYNKQLSSFRSTIETYFANFGKKFKRFDAQHKIRITDNNLYNIQLKLAIVLLNIKEFTNIANINESEYHKKWVEENYNFMFLDPNIQDINENNLSYKTQYKLDNINNIKNHQNNILNGLILSINNDMVLDENVKNNILDIFQKKDENKEKNDKTYELQYIIKHRGNIEDREYYVKWRNYSKNYNSWVKECEFVNKDIIDNYWDTINIE
jgi:hypothetical protein